MVYESLDGTVSFIENGLAFLNNRAFPLVTIVLDASLMFA